MNWSEIYAFKMRVCNFSLAKGNGFRCLCIIKGVVQCPCFTFPYISENN